MTLCLGVGIFLFHSFSCVQSRLQVFSFYRYLLAGCTTAVNEIGS